MVAVCAVLAGVTATGESPAVAAAAADTEPPTAPAGLAASDLSCSSVTLSWSAASATILTGTRS